MPSHFPRGAVALAVLLALAPALPAQQQAPDSAQRLPDVEVIGAPDRLEVIPGSAAVVDRATLENSRVFTTNEALRKVPGLAVRDEEGFGLRPNIGVRGLNPTRSTKVLLLEDGIPFTIAPYGGNETYYHPPIERFSRIEVLKGSGQIMYGPQSVGGVINYLTPAIPGRPTARIGVTGGNRGFLDVRGTGGGTWGAVGALADVTSRRGDGARENVGSELLDASVKGRVVAGRHVVTAKTNWYRERSQVTYSGLTEAEYAAAPYANAFRNDSMLLDRFAASVQHQLVLGQRGALTTTLYGYRVDRDWWRQSSNSAERPNDASDPTCGSIANLNTTCGNQGRLRSYDVWGVEPRLALAHGAFGVRHQLDVGVRAHFEDQKRRQVNGATPNARTAGPSTDPNSGLREDNRRTTDAVSVFVQDRVALGRFTVTPGLRLERVWYTRTNALPDVDVTGETSLTQLVPGLGATFALTERATVFAGVHRGFAPPRPEDVIDGSGTVVDLDAELSWNWEAGVRAQPVPGLRVDATAFRMDFENQIVPASVAGGAGATLTSAGRTLHQGLELQARLDLGTVLRSADNVFVEAAWTWVPTARFEGERYVFVGTGGGDVVGKVYAGQNDAGTRERVSVEGNRLPYAPEQLLTATLGWAHREALEVRAEGVWIGSQFGDALNTETLVPDGQQGPIAGAFIVNLAANYRLPWGTTVFAALKNAFDEVYVVDRTRGLVPGMPRLVQAGVTQTF